MRNDGKGDSVLKVKIWYRYNHDDYTVKEIEVPFASLFEFAYSLKKNGGMMIDEISFIPWHCINHFKEVKE